MLSKLISFEIYEKKKTKNGTKYDLIGEISGSLRDYAKKYFKNIKIANPKKRYTLCKIIRIESSAE